MASLYDFTVTNMRGDQVSLSEYRGKVLLIVNVASRCMYTKQYTELQALYERYQARGFEVLGFPCDQFGHQEPGNNAEIQNFCAANFKITFPLFDKIEVNGAKTAPVYEFLKTNAPGILGTQAIKWNFSKFLVSSDANTITRYAPRVTPDKLATKIEGLLAQGASLGQAAVAP